MKTIPHKEQYSKTFLESVDLNYLRQESLKPITNFAMLWLTFQLSNHVDQSFWTRSTSAEPGKLWENSTSAVLALPPSARTVATENCKDLVSTSCFKRTGLHLALEAVDRCRSVWSVDPCFNTAGITKHSAQSRMKDSGPRENVETCPYLAHRSQSLCIEATSKHSPASTSTLILRSIRRKNRCTLRPAKLWLRG